MNKFYSMHVKGQETSGTNESLRSDEIVVLQRELLSRVFAWSSGRLTRHVRPLACAFRWRFVCNARA